MKSSVQRIYFGSKIDRVRDILHVNFMKLYCDPADIGQRFDTSESHMLKDLFADYLHMTGFQLFIHQ